MLPRTEFDESEKKKKSVLYFECWFFSRALARRQPSRRASEKLRGMSISGNWCYCEQNLEVLLAARAMGSSPRRWGLLSLYRYTKLSEGGEKKKSEKCDWKYQKRVLNRNECCSKLSTAQDFYTCYLLVCSTQSYLHVLLTRSGNGQVKNVVILSRK